MKIKLSLIKPDPNQPRQIIDSQSVSDLAKSMAVEGIIHPIEVDENYQIIVGEMRYRAAVLLGWDEIEANVYPGKISAYDRLRRQMAENLQQSGAKHGGQPMNALDTAKAWARLYELKTGKKFKPGQLSSVELSPITKKLGDEIGIHPDTVRDYLKLLEEPKYILESLLKGVPHTYFRDANQAPDEFKQLIKDNIVAGKYTTGVQVRDDVSLTKSEPELARIRLQNQDIKNSELTNKILRSSVILALALERHPLSEVDVREKGYVIRTLLDIKRFINNYLEKEAPLN